MARIKVKGFFKDLTGVFKVMKKRSNSIKAGSPDNDYSDPIKELANELHPEFTRVVVSSIEEVSPTSKMLTFVPEEGFVLPPFQAGQYVSIDFKIGNTVTSRPYSICSAPFQARQGKDSFFSIAVRKGKQGQGFISDYLYEKVKAGDRFTCHMPFGWFYIEPLRDSKNILALAGGSGITPFYSMAQEIAQGKLDARLTILYGSVDRSDVVLGEKFAEVARTCDKVRVINVISGEGPIRESDERGFLSSDVIAKYMGEDPTFFICGPYSMHGYVLGELAKLGVSERRIRSEVFGASKNIASEKGYPLKEKRTFKLTVCRGIREDVIEASSDESIAVALEREGILIKTRCRCGACGACRVQVLEGECFVPKEGDWRRSADKENGFVHSCSAYPLSDLKIKINIA